MTKPRHPLFQKAIALLESLPNLQATTQGEPYLGDDVLADGELVIQINGKTVHYVCEIKTGITAELTDQITEYFAYLEKILKPKKYPLLITQNLSNVVIDQLLKNKIYFIDVAGSVYLNASEIYLLVRNQFNRNNNQNSLTITTASLQVIYVILRQPKLLLESRLEEKISYFSGTMTSVVKNTLKKLQELNYIDKHKEKYEIIDYVKLLERWELGYSEILRKKLMIGTFHPIGNRLFRDIKQDIMESALDYGYLIGGELAASYLSNYLNPISATLHLYRETNENRIAVNLKLKPHPQGNIIFFRNFGDDEFHKINYKPSNPYEGAFYKQDHLFNKFNFIDPLLVHAELVCSSNSRLKETAQIIYDRYIKNIYKTSD
jgi:hypothetical protein